MKSAATGRGWVGEEVLAAGDHGAEFGVGVGKVEEDVGEDVDSAEFAAGFAAGVFDEVAGEAGFADEAVGQEIVPAVEIAEVMGVLHHWSAPVVSPTRRTL